MDTQQTHTQTDTNTLSFLFVQMKPIGKIFVFIASMSNYLLSDWPTRAYIFHIAFSILLNALVVKIVTFDGLITNCN